jgi:hypothetical protein
VNAAFLIMTSATLAGADPVPPPPLPAAPVVVSGAGCSNCGAPVDMGCCGSSKPGLFDRCKSRIGGFGKKSQGCGCAPAPTCCAPAPVYAPAPTCCAPAQSCCSVANRPNLFDTIKSRCGSKRNKHGPCCTPAPCCDPCAGGAVVGAPPVYVSPPPPMGGTTVPPKEMPKPKVEKPKGGNTSSVPAPLPAVPTVNGATGSPY